MEITWYGHAAFALTFGETKIFIDPFLQANPSFKSQDYTSAIEGTTHVALTHGHHDHISDAVDICQKTGATMMGGNDLCKWLTKDTEIKIDAGNTGGTLVQPGFSMTMVQAHHSSAILDEHGVSHNLGNPHGLVFHIGGEKSVYHMGDTDIFSDMELIQELHRPDIGIVPIGDRFTMGGAVAALACRKYFTFEKIIPCHYGTFPAIEPSPTKFLVAMENMSSRVEIAEVGVPISTI